MSFPEYLQAADASPGSDHLDVRDVANDFKHAYPIVDELSRWPNQPAGTLSRMRFGGDGERL